MRKPAFEIDESDRCLPYTLDLQDDVIYVTTKNLIELERILSDAYILGIDTETRPSFFNRKNRFDRFPTSIIQIAARTKSEQEFVAIVDLLNFSESDGALVALDNVLMKPMSSSDVVKMGQGLENDLREICMFYPKLNAFKDVPSIVDTNVLYRFLLPEIKQDTSLKNLTKTYLHCNLVKTQQCSDWGRRPLAQSQVDYAARDALVLLRLFDAMTCEALEMNDFNLSSLLRRFQHGVSNKISLKTPQQNLIIPGLVTSVVVTEMATSIHTRFDELTEDTNGLVTNDETNIDSDPEPNVVHTWTGEFAEEIVSTAILEHGISHSPSNVSLSSEDSKSVSVHSTSSHNSKKASTSQKSSRAVAKVSKQKKDIWRPIHKQMNIKDPEIFASYNHLKSDRCLG